MISPIAAHHHRSTEDDEEDGQGVGGLGQPSQILHEDPEGDGELTLDHRLLGQGVGDGLGTEEAPLRVLPEAAIHDPRDHRGDAGSHRSQPWRRLGHVASEDLRGLATLEGGPARDGEEADGGQGVQVAPGIHRGPLRLLGTHELRRAHDFGDPLQGCGPASPGRLGIPGRHLGIPGDPEISQEGAARALLDEDVVRLDVPVHHTLGVSVGQGPGELLEEPGRLGIGERTPGADALVEGLAVDGRHREEDEVVDLVHRMDRHDVGMRQLRRRPGLTEEPLAHSVVGGEGGWQELQRHRSVEGDLVRQVDDTHPPAPQLPLQGVAAGQGRLNLDEVLIHALRS